MESETCQTGIVNRPNHGEASSTFCCTSLGCLADRMNAAILSTFGLDPTRLIEYLVQSGRQKLPRGWTVSLGSVRPSEGCLAYKTISQTVDATDSFPPPAEVKQAEAGPSGSSSALCSAYPQLGSVNTWARPGVLYWNTQGQIVCHSSIQVTIAVSMITS